MTKLRGVRQQRCVLIIINVQRFRGGLVYKAHRLCVSLNSGLESNKEEEEEKMRLTIPETRISKLETVIGADLTNLTPQLVQK